MYLKKIQNACLLVLLIGINICNAQEKLRAPAYPLITHNPNFSIWSMDSELNGTLD